MPLSNAHHSVQRLVRSLREQINAVLDPLMAGREAVALLDFPKHSNVGDSAIWLGEQVWLRSRGISVRYVCDAQTYSAEALRRRLPKDGVVLLHGGGNLGDIWPKHQLLRERVLADHRDYRVIQLPQSIHFRQSAALERASQAFASHPDFHLLVRDSPSLETARDFLGASPTLCPDMAFMLDLARPPDSSEVDVLVLARTDHESQGALPRNFGDNVEVVDWLVQPLGDTSRSALAVFAQRVFRGALYRYSRLPILQARHARQLSLLAAYESLAESNVLRGCEILTMGRSVVTDRLHGHILCLLLGQPHAAVDNNYGKVHSFIEAWTKGVPGMVMANSLSDGVRRARELLPGVAGGEI